MGITRRRVLESGAGLLAAAAARVRVSGQSEQGKGAAADLTGRVARYMAAARQQALAVGERENASGQEFLRAVALGYDLCCRWLMALGPNHVRATHRSAEGVSATMAAAGAAASMARLDEKGMRYALSYAVQQVSGV